LTDHWKSEAWAKKIFMAIEQNPATIYITDLDGNIEYVNNTFLETTGYSREEVIGRNARMLRPEQRDQSVYVELWATLKAGRIWKGELQTRRRDGSVFWERMLLAPIRDGNGVITNFMMIKENISELREMMSRLQESENRFLGAMSVMVEGFALLSPEGEYLFSNQTFNDFFQLPESHLIGQKPCSIRIDRLNEDGSVCPQEEYPAVETLRTGRPVRNRVLGFRFDDGSVRWAQINTSLVPMGEDGRAGVVLTFSEITERRKTEQALKLAYEAIRQSGEGVFIVDAEQRVVSVNPAFETMTGFSAQEAVGKAPEFFALGRHDTSFLRDVREALQKHGHWQGEVWSRRKHGDFFLVWLGVSAVDDDKGQPQFYIYIFSDMTERKAAQEKIEFLAHHDALTGLPNRLLLRDRMELAMAKANRMKSRVAMIFLDLDRFKTINDSLGHPIGDALLREVVERLKACVRESDTISRQGGDEFVVLLDDIHDTDAVARVADKIHLHMAEPFLLEGHTLMTSFSMGVAMFPDDGDDFDVLMQKADTAMYHAKAAGRNAHRFFTEEMNLQVVEHLNLENQLRHALKNGEFVLHYQPQLSLRDGRIVGVEALIRWKTREGELVPPARFIPVAEDSGLIVHIGAWVLREACRQARAWQDAGLQPFVVAVNLSAMQFKRQDLVNNVINALVLSDLDSEWLELELTESILIQDAEATLEMVRRLKSLGVKLSVDDFGTGYSSLAYLKRFAVDKLKIDQSFVRDLLTDPDDAAIVRAIIEMAHSLKLQTIAEGVETEELANLLRIFNCDEAQGYWYARPMPAGELEVFVRERQGKPAVQS